MDNAPTFARLGPLARLRLRGLEAAYAVAAHLAGRLRAGGIRLDRGRVEACMRPLERLTKGPLFDCRMCGQCILHASGMTCPMTCPKNIRNGPCGGVRADGGCEVEPGRTCTWVLAWERSRAMPRYGAGIHALQPPLDWRLQGTASWSTEIAGPPAGQ